MKLLVLSDLHIFSSRHEGASLDFLSNSLSDIDICVLNGDIFDLQDAHRKPDIECLAELAAMHLESYARMYPYTDFHFVIGNHERFEIMREMLEELDALLPNFHFHTDHLIIGNAMFIHGDMQLSPKEVPSADTFWETRDDYAYWKLPNRVNGAAATVGQAVMDWVSENKPNGIISKVLGKIMPNFEASSKQIDEYLSGNFSFTKIKHVFFGHIHQLASPNGNELGYEFNGRNYYNTGTAAIGDKSRFNPLIVEFDAKCKVKLVSKPNLPEWSSIPEAIVTAVAAFFASKEKKL